MKCMNGQKTEIQVNNMRTRSLMNWLKRLEQRSQTARIQEGDPIATNLEGIGIDKEIIVGLTYQEAANHIAEKIGSIESDREEYQHPKM